MDWGCWVGSAGCVGVVDGDLVVGDWPRGGVTFDEGTILRWESLVGGGV